jgi:hypothetical protein
MTHNENVALGVPRDPHERVVAPNILDHDPSPKCPVTLRHALSVRPFPIPVECSRGSGIGTES